MKLLELHLRNFKGIKEFDFISNGKDSNIYGDNATGKTTLADAFRWLLFNKDTKNQSVFDIKTLDGNGNPIPGINHEVSAKIEIDEKILELKKVYYEKWTKKRGSLEKELTGHSNDYFIDDIPYKEKNYKEYISSIIDEEKFKLLTDPFFFPEIMSWQDRRALLFNICGDIEDLEIINSDKELSELIEILNGKSIDEYRKLILSKKTKINEKLDDIPIRIDEASRSIKEIDKDENEITKTIEKLNNELEIKNKEKSNLEHGGGIVEKQRELTIVKSQIENHLYAKQCEKNKIKSDLNKKLSETESLYEKIIQNITEKEKAYDSIDEIIDDYSEKIKKLRNEWHERNDQVFNEEDQNIKTVCPACLRPLEPEKIQEAYQKTLENFNKEKSESLEKIQLTGKGLKDEMEKMISDKEKLKTEIEKLKEEKEIINEKANNLENEIDSLEKYFESYKSCEGSAYKEDNDYRDLKIKEENLIEEIENLKKGDYLDTLGTVLKQIDFLKESLLEAESELLQIKHNQSIDERIKELKKQEKTLSKEYEKLEKDLYLLDLFIKTKANMVEENINNKFNLANFKLFKILINGGLEPCCEVTDKNGVPYSTGLNRGACINIGLDIINTLSEYYKFSAPIFIDNAEAITNILPTKGQQIRLYVQANQDNLKVLTA